MASSHPSPGPTGSVAAGPQPAANAGPNRRSFLRQIGWSAGASLAVAGAGAPAAAGTLGTWPDIDSDTAPVAWAMQRRNQAFQLRHEAARMAAARPLELPRTNGDERAFSSRIGSYSKGLPHNALGEVDAAAYQTLLTALASSDAGPFEGITLGLGRPLVNPQASLAFDLQGADAHHLYMPPPPPVASAGAAAELAEVYWMALARDVSFADYDADPVIAAAAAELSAMSAFQGRGAAGSVAPQTVFRGDSAGDTIGPYLSQFLWLEIPMGAMHVAQRMYTTPAGLDFMTDYPNWLAIQNGYEPPEQPLETAPRHLRSLRDLAQWVHVDALYQAYHQACLILIGLGAPLDPGNPYARSRTQIGFGTFGEPHVLSLVTEVATRALKAAWYQKWMVHRRVRPEAMAGLVHHWRTGTAEYPLHTDILHARAVDEVFRRHGTGLLPMAYIEGSPTHPAYPAGHATVAGACVTMLKAWFDEHWVLPDPVVADRWGTVLLPYSGPDLTVGHELNKLAANVAIGRNAAGVHYRSDYRESLRLGEAVALTILAEQRLTYNEPHAFTLTTFDGVSVTV